MVASLRSGSEGVAGHQKVPNSFHAWDRENFVNQMPVSLRRYRAAKGHDSAYNFCLNITGAFRDMSHVATNPVRNDVVAADFFASLTGSASSCDHAPSPVEQVFRLFFQFVTALPRCAGCFLLKLCATGFTAMGVAEVHHRRAERGSPNHRNSRDPALMSNGCVLKVAFCFGSAFLGIHSILPLLPAVSTWLPPPASIFDLLVHLLQLQLDEFPPDDPLFNKSAKERILPAGAVQLDALHKRERLHKPLASLATLRPNARQ